MERRRGAHRGHGRGLALATGLAIVAFGVLGASPSAGAVEAPLPLATIETTQDGFVLVDGVRPCSNVSSATDQLGQVMVQRTGPTDAALTVHYSSQPSVGGESDFEPLPGAVTIPAGETTATIDVTPKFQDQPPPIHVHRTSSLTITLQDDADYNLGAASTAVVNMRFDIAVFECPPAPVTPATTPTVPPTTPPATLPATGPPTTAPAATLPSTAAPLTAELGGIALALLALGLAGVRYGRPRRLRIRAGWR